MLIMSGRSPHLGCVQRLACLHGTGIAFDMAAAPLLEGLGNIQSEPPCCSCPLPALEPGEPCHARPFCQAYELCRDHCETIKLTVVDYNQGGLVACLLGLKAFIPFSHLDKSAGQLCVSGPGRSGGPGRKASKACSRAAGGGRLHGMCALILQLSHHTCEPSSPLLKQ